MSVLLASQVHSTGNTAQAKTKKELLPSLPHTSVINISPILKHTALKTEIRRIKCCQRKKLILPFTRAIEVELHDFSTSHFT